MGKDTKILLGILLGTFLGIGALVVVLGRNGGSEGKTENSQEVLGVSVSPESYQLGNVPIKGGLVTKEYEVKNTTDKALRIKKIATSCMCTTAKIKIGDKESRAFGMEMTGDRNPIINFDLPSGETAKVTVVFDPAAHGPSGTGPFDRIVWLTFSDPGGIKELKFNGTVVSQ